MSEGFQWKSLLLRGFASSLPLLDKLVSFDLYFQLSTIYETKPPISKAKVASVTRLAVKAIKVCVVFIYNTNNRKETFEIQAIYLSNLTIISLQYYKHVVQSIEKFAQKVRPDSLSFSNCQWYCGIINFLLMTVSESSELYFSNFLRCCSVGRSIKFQLCM